MENLIIKNHSTEMVNIIQEWEQSGQSQKLFYQTRTIRHSKFYYALGMPLALASENTGRSITG